jgi:hypothetical protein
MTDSHSSSKGLGDEQQGYKRVNDIVIQQITEKVRQRPSADLSETLRQVAATYPKIRRALGDVAARQSHSATSTKPKDDSPRARIAEVSLIQGDAQLLRPFSSRIVDSLFPEFGSASTLSEAPINKSLSLSLEKTISEGQLLWKLGNTQVLALNSSFAVKIGDAIDISHLPTLQLIKDSCPGLPAPDVHGVLKSGQTIYLFMSLAEGISLDRIWSKLDRWQRVSIQSQLNEIFASIWKIPQSQICPDMELGGGQPARCMDMRRSLRLASSAIANENDFNDFLCSDGSRTPDAWVRMVRSFLTDKHKIVVTHGDLHPRNIMVTWDTLESHHIPKESHPEHPDSDLRITMVIDWECCGCYPEYWEYVKALNTIRPKDPFSDWIEYLPTKAIGVWPSELSTDILLSRWLG